MSNMPERIWAGRQLVTGHETGHQVWNKACWWIGKLWAKEYIDIDKYKELQAENTELKKPVIDERSATEIIPKNRPEWANIGFREGTFFSVALAKVEELEAENAQLKKKNTNKENLLDIRNKNLIYFQTQIEKLETENAKLKEISNE